MSVSLQYYQANPEHTFAGTVDRSKTIRKHNNVKESDVDLPVLQAHKPDKVASGDIKDSITELIED